jgi:aspartyl-tRNA(Asn)/glutamyl-tRNA(Gln) amidotransferase subunit C
VTLERAEVAHLAALARLGVTEDELTTFAGQLEVILASVATVAEVAAADVPPTSHPLPLTNVTRPDVVTASLSRDEVLAAAPAAQDGRFLVPRILDDDE